MDIKELEEVNESIAILKELDLPISIEQLGKRQKLETEFLREKIVPHIQSYIQSLVEHLHKPFCLVVEYQYGTPVEVRIAEKTNIKIETNKGKEKVDATKNRKYINPYSSERIKKEWEIFLESLPTGNTLIKYTVTYSYNSLSKLLREMQSKDMRPYTFKLFEALKLPTTGKITPLEFKNMLEPEQLVRETTKDGVWDRIVLWSQTQKVETRYDGTRIKVFKEDGITPVMVDKVRKIKEGQWSLKKLCELMAQKEYFENKRLGKSD